MGKVCTSCGGDIADPKLPEEEDENCENCDDTDDDMAEDDSDMDDDA